MKKTNYKTWKNRIICATPLISLTIFLLVGYTTHVWNPTWVVFLLIPIVPIVLSESFVYSIYPILLTATYLVLGFAFSWWHPGWVLFLTIPIYYILFGEEIKKKIKKDTIEIIDEE